jgi:hypothetical protein
MVKEIVILYGTLYNSDWSCIFNENSVDSAVYNLTATASETADVPIPFVKHKNSTFPQRFSRSIICHSPSQVGASVLQMTYPYFWTYLAKLLSPLMTLSLYGKVTRLL